MTKEEVQRKIKEVSCEKHGIEVFACIKEQDHYCLKKIKGTDKLRSRVLSKLGPTMASVFLAEDAEFESSDNIADNKRVLYEIVQSETYRPFAFLKAFKSVSAEYTENDKENFLGFLFRINHNDKFFWIYQHIYTMSRIDRSKNVLAVLSKNTYDAIDDDVIQIAPRIDVLVLDDSIITSKIDLLQKYFGFEQYIRDGAKKTIAMIQKMDIVIGLEKFIALESKSKLTNSKKILKASGSPVLQMDKRDLLSSLKRHARYSQMFNVKDDRIEIHSQKDAAAFIKMLNDDIVRSDLTGQEYDSSSKSKLEPLL